MCRALPNLTEKKPCWEGRFQEVQALRWIPARRDNDDMQEATLKHERPNLSGLKNANAKRRVF